MKTGSAERTRNDPTLCTTSMRSATLARIIGPRNAGVRQRKPPTGRTIPPEARSRPPLKAPSGDAVVDNLLHSIDLTLSRAPPVIKPKFLRSDLASKSAQDAADGATLRSFLSCSENNAGVSALREMLRNATKRIAELEAKLQRLHSQTIVASGPDIAALLSETNDSFDISVADLLRPMPALEPASWEQERAKLIAKCRELVDTLQKERAEHEQIHKLQRTESLGLARRLKYALLRTKEIELKFKEQNSYIADCENAILKQQQSLAQSRALLSRTFSAISETADLAGQDGVNMRDIRTRLSKLTASCAERAYDSTTSAVPQPQNQRRRASPMAPRTDHSVGSYEEIVEAQQEDEGNILDDFVAPDCLLDVRDHGLNDLSDEDLRPLVVRSRSQRSSLQISDVN